VHRRQCVTHRSIEVRFRASGWMFRKDGECGYSATMNRDRPSRMQMVEKGPSSSIDAFELGLQHPTTSSCVFHKTGTSLSFAQRHIILYDVVRPISPALRNTRQQWDDAYLEGTRAVFCVNFSYTRPSRSSCTICHFRIIDGGAVCSARAKGQLFGVAVRQMPRAIDLERPGLEIRSSSFCPARTLKAVFDHLLGRVIFRGRTRPAREGLFEDRKNHACA
jgi:hypothetical protein